MCRLPARVRSFRSFVQIVFTYFVPGHIPRVVTGEPRPLDVASSEEPRPLSGLLSSEHPLTDTLSPPVDS